MQKNVLISDRTNLQWSFNKNNQTIEINSNFDLEIGYAFKKIQRSRFNENQKKYLIENFKIGEEKDRKVCQDYWLND